MSQQEKKSGGSDAPLMVVEQTAASRPKLFRSPDVQDEAPDLHHKHLKAPVVETVAEELKDLSAQEAKDSDHAMSSDKQKSSIVKKFSSITKKKGPPSLETITLAPVEVDTKRSSHQPIPANVETVASHSSNLLDIKGESSEKGQDDSITDEIAELRTPDMAQKHSEWSDDEEAGGLPRSESRASRVSRAVRQLLCCGMRYEAASEDDLSSRPGFAI